MRPAAKNYVVDAVLNIVQSRPHSIRSGWKVVLYILRVVASDSSDEEVVQSGFTAVTSTLRHRSLFQEFFQDTILTASAFANCKVSVATSVEAIKFLHRSADYLHTKRSRGDSNPASSPSDAQSESSGLAPEDTTSHTVSILRCLSSVVEDQRQDVRLAALETLFEILCGLGACFDTQGWHMVSTEILSPLFAGFQKRLTAQDASMGKTVAPIYVSALKALVRVFDVQSSAWSPPVLESVLALLKPPLQLVGEAAPIASEAQNTLRQLESFADREHVDKASLAMLKQAAKELLA
jgi:hypothetical protein